MSQLSRDNFHQFLAAFIKHEKLNARQVAGVIGASESTITRLTVATTLPSDEMLKQGAFMFELGFERYSKLSAAERNNLSETIGAVSGGAVGFASIAAAISAFGSVAGLSAAGITSGLAALGAFVGAGMAAGVAVAAAIPLAIAGLGVGVVKTVQHFISENQMNAKEIDLKWETINESRTRGE
jgi:hypothetical protein